MFRQRGEEEEEGAEVMVYLKSRTSTPDRTGSCVYGFEEMPGAHKELHSDTLRLLCSFVHESFHM